MDQGARGRRGRRADARGAREIAQPFVFRKYLDFGTIDAVRKLHAQIRQEVARRDLAGDVKLGPGGIREIEFIAQGFQLIRGGRDPGLRARATLEVLAALGARRQLDAPAVAELSAAYVFLRRLEHRLQYLEDAQTHALPESPGDRRLVAESMGASDWETFARELDGHRTAVTRHFDRVFAAAADETNASARVWQDTLEGDVAARDLAARGYVEPRETLARIRALRASARYQQLPESSRERLDLLVPRFIEACAQAQSAAAPGERVVPDVALRRAFDFVESISRRASYLALLAEQPSALAKVAGILAASSWAAEYLTRHPILLDELLDARVLGEAPDWSEFATTLRREMAAHDGDVERQMDAMREIHHAWVFRLLMQDLAGLLTVERLGDHLSLAADLVLAVTIEVCWKLVRTRHAEIPRFAVIGYGKLGGKELGYASDLDIVFVYDDPHEAAAENYARLAQRMNSWLSSRTPAGTLFETDLALRPSGGAGLLVSSMSAFKRYQLESAWLWEHQALTRARFCAGDAAIGAVFDALRRDLLQASRDPAKLAAEVLTMRQKMLDAHPNRSDLFDLKHDRGGMVDIEFIVQYLVLAHSRAHYELTGNLGNIALLHMAGALGLVPAGLAHARRRRVPGLPAAAAPVAAQRRRVRARRARERRGARRRDARTVAGGVRVGPLDGAWQLDPELLRPRNERGHRLRVERHAFRELALAQLEPALAGHAHGRIARLDRRGPAGVRQPPRLARERVAAAERAGIDDLHEHRGAPALLVVGTPVPGERRSQRFDEQREAETLVPQVHPAERQDRARRTGQEHRRIVARVAPVVDEPRAGQPLALPRAVEPRDEAVGRRRGADVDQHRQSSVGKPSAMRVRREAAGDGAIRRDRTDRVRAQEQHHEPAVGRARQVGRQAADVMRAADRHGDHRGARRAGERACPSRAARATARGGSCRPTSSPRRDRRPRSGCARPGHRARPASDWR